MGKYLALLASALVFAPTVTLSGQTQSQLDYKFLNSIAACRTTKCVSGKRTSANGKVERTVLYAKWMLLDPSSRTASQGILDSLPTTKEEFVQLMTLPDWHEDATTSQADMSRLATVYESWPRLLSVAVLRFPQYLAAYIRHGRLAITDPHSDYTVQERKLCRTDQKRFAAVFRSLAVDDQEYIRKYVFEPDTCKPIFVGEADP